MYNLDFIFNIRFSLEGIWRKLFYRLDGVFGLNLVFVDGYGFFFEDWCRVCRFLRSKVEMGEGKEVVFFWDMRNIKCSLCMLNNKLVVFDFDN